MSYEKLYEELGEDKDEFYPMIHNLTNMYGDEPYLMKELLSILSDDSIFLSMIPTNNKKALCKLLKKYFSTCWTFYLDNLNLSKLLEYGKVEIYRIETANGIRYATTNEVSNGVRGLIGEYIYPAGEQNYKRLCLLQWTLHGTWYFFRQAGYNLKYSEDGKVTTTFLEMVIQSANGLNDLLDWLTDEEDMKNSLNKIKKMKKTKGYKYASYEKDEITEVVTPKQLILNIVQILPKGSDNKMYRKAIALALRNSKKPLTPSEISWLREIYNEYISTNKITVQNSNGNDVNTELKDKCELLIKERFNGKINQKHFAYTIIDTIKKYNYKKCSPKQYSIIEDAYNELTGGNTPVEEANNNEIEIISDDDIDMSMEALSNAIGDGLFED